MLGTQGPWQQSGWPAWAGYPREFPESIFANGGSYPKRADHRAAKRNCYSRNVRIRARTGGSAPFPVRERQASIDQREKPDRAEPMLASEPTERTQASEAAEPMDRIEPDEPMDRIEPDADAALGAEPSLIAMKPLCRNG